MARDHIFIKIPDDAEPSTSKIDVAKTSTSKIDDNDGAKTSSTSKIDEIEEILDEDNDDGGRVSKGGRASEGRRVSKGDVC
jgi:hypothetical protein